MARSRASSGTTTASRTRRSRSLFDFPTNDPSYAAIGVPEFGFRGDIRYLGSRRRRSAPDRSAAPVQGVRQLLDELGPQPRRGRERSAPGRRSRRWRRTRTTRTRARFRKGLAARASRRSDGFKTRTPFTYDVNLHADYAFKMGGTRRVVLLADVFNLFNVRRATGYDQDTESIVRCAEPRLRAAGHRPGAAVPDAVPAPVGRAVRVLSRSKLS